MTFRELNGRSAWFALGVKPRHEKTTLQHLETLGVEGFLPTYRSRRLWSGRRRTIDACLFPGYVFGRIAYPDRLRVLNLPGVRRIVGFGKREVAVPEAEIDSIRSILVSGNNVWPWPYLRAGERVRLDRGPLAGLEGTLLREKDSWRVVVGIDLLQRSVAVEVDRDAVCAVAPRRTQAPRNRLSASLPGRDVPVFAQTFAADLPRT